MRTPSSDRDAAITSWPPARSCCRYSIGADAQDGAASGLPAIHPAATSNRTQVSAQVSQPCVPRPRAEKENTAPPTTSVVYINQRTELIHTQEENRHIMM